MPLTRRGEEKAKAKHDAKMDKWEAKKADTPKKHGGSPGFYSPTGKDTKKLPKVKITGILTDGPQKKAGKNKVTVKGRSKKGLDRTDSGSPAKHGWAEAGKRGSHKSWWG